MTLNLGSLSSFSTTNPFYVLDLTSARFSLIALLYVLLYSLTISSNLTMYIFSWNWSHRFMGFIFRGSNKLFRTKSFPSLWGAYNSILLSCNHDFIDLLQNWLPLSTHVLLGWRIDLPRFFGKELNKDRIPLLYLFISYISVISATKTLSARVYLTFFKFFNN